jgi:integrase
MGCLKTVLEEASTRHDFASPFKNIKRLREPRANVEPFTLNEINLFMSFVHEGFRDYYWVRFFTAMRTAEIDGLKWEHVDFHNRLILIRETLVDGETETPKTDGSLRDIKMLGPVYEALQRQHLKTGDGKYVFTNLKGKPLEHRNVTYRVWYPTLEKAGLRKRNPYQTRHTAATLWLAAGENPEWIAQQMGHANTRMLFTVYSRFVPNLTRQDGSAFENLLASHIEGDSDAS